MKNIILVTMDEVRPDHLSCYGYDRISTSNIDFFADNGVRFQTVISTSCFTPLSHATILSGVYPDKHCLRDPFAGLAWDTVAQTFRAKGYKTAGFVGVNLLGKANRFHLGFDYFDEPGHDEVWKRSGFPGEERGELLWGNWWIPRMLDWVRRNREHPFFIWTHYFDVHQAAENILLEMGKIKEGVMPEFGYMDPKIEYMDRAYFGALRQTLDELGLMDKTTVAITSDHGTNVGEHDVPPFPHLDLVYPQHVTLYDCDLLVPLILKDPDLPPGKVIPGMVRTVDIVPTLLDLHGIEPAEDLDGTSLIPFVHDGKAADLTAYAEEMYEKRGPGDFQAVRNDRFKLIIDYRSGKEEFYDVLKDPGEHMNLIDKLDETQKALVVEWRSICRKLAVQKDSGFRMGDEDRAKVTKRLKSLGYIE
jgi:arylsulfatase A-like enzyme